MRLKSFTALACGNKKCGVNKNKSLRAFYSDPFIPWNSGPVSAPSKDHAAFYFEIQDIKAIEKTYLGQCAVAAQTTPYDGVVWAATVGSEVLELTSNCLEYNYLTEIFHKQYMHGIAQLNDELGG